jgi:hypothetical protein
MPAKKKLIQQLLYGGSYGFSFCFTSQTLIGQTDDFTHFLA